MAKTREQKKEMLAAYKQKLQGSTGVIVVSQTGLTPKDVNSFKQKLRDVSSSYGVVKNSIFALALKEAGLPELETFASGPHAVIFVDQDIAGAAKLLRDFIKESKDKVQIKAGILEGQKLELAQVEDLANLPSMEQSVAMIAGLLQQSMAGVVNVLEDSVRSIAIILDKAFAEKTA